MAVRANRIIGTLVMVVGVCVVLVGVFFAAFGWMNDGAMAGLGLLLIPGGFGAAAIAVGASLHVVARLHASGSRWRWWSQVLLPLVTLYLAFGLAAEFSVLVDRHLRP